MADLNLNIPLLTKMWETLDERFIAPWMNPKRIVREGMARLEVEKAERLQAIELERVEVEARRGGELVAAGGEPYIDFQRLAEIEQQQEYIRKQTNLGRSILHAENEIKADDPVPEKEVDPDWLYRWKEQAEKFSADDMQLLWGKVLAGEFKDPGTFNYRTLNVLSSLSKEDADAFVRLCSMAITEPEIIFIVDNDEVCREHGLTYLDMLRLRELGLLSYSNSSYTASVTKHFYFEKHEKLLMFPSAKEVKLSVFLFTAVGEALYNLIDVEMNLPYFRSILNLKLTQEGMESILVHNVEQSQDGNSLIWRSENVEKFSAEGSSDS